MASGREREMKRLQKFPPGIRFVPRDEELIVAYLLPKLADKKLPYDIINDTNVYGFEPQEIAEKYKECGKDKWYFFTTRQRKYSNGSRPDRTVKNGIGFWKLTGADKTIRESEEVLGKRKIDEELNKSMEGGNILGKKKVLVYYEGHGRNNKKTDWIMYEYIAHCEKDEVEMTSNATNKLDECVLCVIKKKGSEEKESSGATNTSTSMAFQACNENSTSMAASNYVPLQGYSTSNMMTRIANMTDDYLLAPDVAVNGDIGGSGTPDYSSSMVSFNHQAAQNTEDHGAMVAAQAYDGTGSMAFIAPNNSQIMQNTEDYGTYDGTGRMAFVAPNYSQALQNTEDYGAMVATQACDGTGSMACIAPTNSHILQNSEGHGAMFDFEDLLTVDELIALLSSSPPRPGGISELFEENNNEGLGGQGQVQQSVSDYVVDDLQYHDGSGPIQPWEPNASNEVSFDPQAELPPKS